MATILRIDGVLCRTGQRSKTSIYCAAKEGLFTTPVKIGNKTTGWPDYEVDILVSAQVAGQSKDEIRELVNQLHAQRMERFKALLNPATAMNTSPANTNVVQMAGAR